MVHASAKHALEQRRKYARWLDAEDPMVVANAMLVIIGRALNMLKSQIATQGEVFEQKGGFSERLVARRIKAREEQRQSGASPQDPPPQCPNCGKGMRRRRSAKGEFWGCSGYPECRGTRQIELGRSVDEPSTGLTELTRLTGVSWGDWVNTVNTVPEHNLGDRIVPATEWAVQNSNL